MRIASISFVLSFLFLLLVSCGDDDQQSSGQRTLPESTGKINELVVVISDQLWEGELGIKLRERFAHEVDGLPQNESEFTLVQVRPKAFSNIFKTHRNLMILEFDTVNKVQMARDVFASGQYVAQFKGENDDALLKVLTKTGKDVLEKFKKEELLRIQKANQKAELKSFTSLLSKKHQLNLCIPKDFRLNVEGENFYWLNREKPYATEGVLVYFTALPSDFDMMSQILATRDSVTKIYVEGELENTYMQIERLYDPIMEPFEMEGSFAVKTRGLWRMENDFMGGSFMSYTILDEENNRAIYIDGFVFAPSKDKRNYMTQLEAILASVSLQ